MPEKEYFGVNNVKSLVTLVSSFKEGNGGHKPQWHGRGVKGR